MMSKKRSWVAKDGVRLEESVAQRLGVEDLNGDQAIKGTNPFYNLTVGGKRMSGIVKVYDPPYKISTNVYSHIKDNVAGLVEEAIQIRRDY